MLFGFGNYSGPIPPATEMIKYEKGTPGSSNRILKMAELHAETSSKVILSDAKVRNRDSMTERIIFIIVAVLIFIICVLSMLIGAFLIYNDKGVYGICLITIPFGIILLAVIKPIKAKLMNLLSIQSNKR